MKKLALLAFLAIFAAMPAFADDTAHKLPAHFKIEDKRIKIDGEKGQKYIVLAADGVEYTSAGQEGDSLVIRLNITGMPRGMTVKGIPGAEITLTTPEGEVFNKKVTQDEEIITFNRLGAVKITMDMPKKS